MPEVVSCLLMNKQKQILILKRSQKVRTYKGKWGVAAGYIEEDETPYETALKEIQEETGLREDDVRLFREGNIIRFTDVDENTTYHWEVHPFLFFVETDKQIQIDWEHTEYRWIDPVAIEQYETVPRLKEIVHKLFPEE